MAGTGKRRDWLEYLHGHWRRIPALQFPEGLVALPMTASMANLEMVFQAGPGRFRWTRHVTLSVPLGDLLTKLAA